MRPFDDPLEKWLFSSQFQADAKAEVIEAAQDEVDQGLQRLEKWLDNPPPPSRFDMMNVRLWPGYYGSFASGKSMQAANLYRRVFEMGGTGSRYVQEELLTLLALTLDPAQIPFWVSLFDLAKPHDNFANQRRKIALAALALMAIRRAESAATDALWQAARHRLPEVRANAIFYVGRVHQECEQPISESEGDTLAHIAVTDAAFAPRFQAREVLRQQERPVSLDNPGGAYGFKVKYPYDKRIYRTIEVRSEQTLEDLHHAIQAAFKWDADHLFSFYMTNDDDDQRYRVACPYEDEGPWTDEAVIGELGLPLKHKFMYYFDYGDSHRFEVEVVAIHPKAEGHKYPRVVERKGESPEQYG